ncbi:MAG: hypothetical protein M1818_005613 [Claussenomyces sp. TS43310]|nr:MAG: hypothetical protein M1818_005613 [Claussenomyces sp. TS43310]
MPPERPRSGPKPFKPPRPSASNSTPASGSKAQPQKAARPPRPSASTSTPASRSFESTVTPNDVEDPDDEEDPYADTPPLPKAVTTTLAATSDGTTERATIPSELLTRLLHDFMSDGMRISKGADKAMGLYVETFVREAIARAAFERNEAGNGDGFLEVGHAFRRAFSLEANGRTRGHGAIRSFGLIKD